MTVYFVAYFAKIQPVHVRRRHFYWSESNWLHYAQIETYFYGETLNALYEENVIPLIHDSHLSDKKTIYLKN